MKNKFLSVAAVKRLFKKLGGKSAGKKACLELQNKIESYAVLIGKLAIKNALYEGRTSVKDKDIKEAIRELEEK